MKALAWTFVHSLWQGLVAAFLAAIIISVTRKTTARLRYNLLGMVLVLFVLTTFMTFLGQLEGTEEEISSITTGNDFIITILSTGFITDLTSWFNNNSGLVLLAWLFFFLIHCIKLLTGLAAVNRMRNYKIHPVTEMWQATLPNLCNRLGLRQPVALYQSELVKVPLALGFFKPVILLPIGLITQLPAEQVEAILLHELAHIRRKDYFVNFLQYFAEAIFFFNPGMLWLSSLIRQEREACCDDIVLQNSEEKRNYLNALVAFQEFSVSRNQYAMAFTHKRYDLLHRVQRMLTNENKGVSVFEKTILLGSVILFSAFTYVKSEKELMEFVGDTIAIQEVKPSVQILVPQDTIPPRKPAKKVNTRVKTKPALTRKKDEVNAKSEADRVLQEIIQLKEQIGEKKVQLNKDDGKNKAAILRKIAEERGEVEVKRAELNRKRLLHEKLKEQNQRRGLQNEQRREMQKENQKENQGELQKDLAIKKDGKISYGTLYEFKPIILKDTKLSLDAKLFDTKLNGGIKESPKNSVKQIPVKKTSVPPAKVKPDTRVLI